MMATVQCARCRRTQEALAAPPFRAPALSKLGREVQARVCAPCFQEWREVSLKVVNEARLEASDPANVGRWIEQMKAFLGLSEGAGDPWARFLNKRVRVETTDGVIARATLVACDGESLTLADFAGGAPPKNFAYEGSLGTAGATVARDAVLTLEEDSA